MSDRLSRHALDYTLELHSPGETAFPASNENGASEAASAQSETATSTRKGGARLMRELLYGLHTAAGVSQETLLAVGLRMQQRSGVGAYGVGRTVVSVSKYKQRCRFADRYGVDPVATGCIGPLRSLADVIEDRSRMGHADAVELAVWIWWLEMRQPDHAAELAAWSERRGGDLREISRRQDAEREAWLAQARGLLAKGV